ncbi:MAG: DUF2950 domain-containing protein [Alphaproteobacteria bacterium]
MVERLRLVWTLGVGTVLLIVCATSGLAQETFDTPDAAVGALIAAVKAGNRNEVLKILGPDGAEVISSGDDVADRNAGETFVAAFDEKHSLESEGDDATVLVVGSDDWPFPIPVVKSEGKWEFDTDAGLEEILLRRIGRNELSAMQAILAYVVAQNEYAAVDVDGRKPPSYAQRFLSSPGKKDGLYWLSDDEEDESPLGPLFAEATDEGYEFSDQPRPYHGYYYRILTRQGPAAKGGAFDYIVDGRMIGGFGLIAYPAQYGNAGIMTFMINHDGVIFEKDLGPDTVEVVDEIDSFDPDDTWKTVEPPSE